MQKNQWYFLLVAVHDKPCGFVCTVVVDYSTHLHFAFFVLGNQALVGHNAHGPSIYPGIAAYNSLAVVFFKFIQYRPIHYAFNNVPYIIRLCIAFAHYTVNTVRIFRWQFGSNSTKARYCWLAKFIHYFFYLVQAFLLGIKFIICNTAYFGMCNCTTQCFVVYVFANGSFNKVTARQKNGAVVFDHQCFVAHYGQVGPACNAGTHYGCNLCYAQCTHFCIVSEYPAKMFLVGEYLVLHRQVHTCTIHQVNNGQPVFHGNFLHPQILLACYGKPCTCLNRLVVGHNYTLPAAYITNTGNGTTCGAAALRFVHLEPCKGAYFCEYGVGIN